MFSAVLIIPVELRDDANLLGEVLGWGPNNYSVPLGATSEGPATHYGLHSWVEQSFVDLVSGARQGVLPPLEGITPEQVTSVVSALTMSIRDWDGGHFQEVLAANNLVIYYPPEEV